MARIVTDEVKASTTLAGLVKLSLAAVDTDNPIAVGDNDPRLGGGGGDATTVTYTPGVPADWPDPDPTTVQQALDGIAAGGIGGGGGSPNLDGGVANSTYGGISPINCGGA